jgi:hypothetical protein
MIKMCPRNAVQAVQRMMAEPTTIIIIAGTALKSCNALMQLWSADEESRIRIPNARSGTPIKTEINLPIGERWGSRLLRMV